MSKIINCSIDVKMIDKSKIKIHANGSHYWNFTVKERKEPDQYGNTHYIVETQTKDERDAKTPQNYLKSSGKEMVFANGTASAQAQQVANAADEDDDLPF
jgi:basic membrane lipoprotein Med (substrate-binding protein (PBP1-ABC) superfamily)